jgi:hypothetical protein
MAEETGNSSNNEYTIDKKLDSNYSVSNASLQ